MYKLVLLFVQRIVIQDVKHLVGEPVVQEMDVPEDVAQLVERLVNIHVRLIVMIVVDRLAEVAVLVTVITVVKVVDLDAEHLVEMLVVVDAVMVVLLHVDRVVRSLVELHVPQHVLERVKADAQIVLLV